MASEANAQTRVALPVEILPHPAHFFWSAGETVDQQTGWF